MESLQQYIYDNFERITTQEFQKVCASVLASTHALEATSLDVLREIKTYYGKDFKYIDNEKYPRSGTYYNSKLTAMERSPRDDIYGFTFNPYENKKLLGVPIGEIDDDQLIDIIFKDIQKSRVWNGTKAQPVKFMIFPEYSKTGKLHFHGIIYGCFPALASRIRKWCMRKYCFAPGFKLELKLTSKHSWFKYMTKDYGKTGLKYRSLTNED